MSEKTKKKRRISEGHKLTTRYDGGEKPIDRRDRYLIKQSILMTLKAEAVDMLCAVHVLITDDKGIRAYNEKHRGIGKATDVLSFPMQEFKQAGWQGIVKPDIDLDTQTIPLGDIVISMTSIRRNARVYGHTVEKEMTRMIIHSSLHLLGYDHGADMEQREEILMERMGYLSD